MFVSWASFCSGGSLPGIAAMHVFSCRRFWQRPSRSRILCESVRTHTHTHICRYEMCVCTYNMYDCTNIYIYTGCLQMNGAVSEVNKKFISHLTRAKPTPLAAATVQVSHALPAVSSLVLTAGLRGQFPRWRRSRERLSVCSVLRCPDLWLQCSVSLVHGLEKTHHMVRLF